jgi:putative hydrolase of the HAD superfamily
MPLKVVGFDYFGTLVDAKANINDCFYSMFKHLETCGISLDYNDFLDSYQTSVRRYRKIRNQELREVNNCIWLRDTLKNMGYQKEKSDPVIVSTVKTYFNAWNLTIFPDVSNVLERISQKYKTALVSNFTDTSFLKKTLYDFGIKKYLDTVITSDQIGWRKPHQKIFEFFLNHMMVQPEEAVFIGDNLEADVKGSKEAGIISVLLKRKDTLHKNNHIKPDYTISSLTELEALLENKFS